LNVTKATKLIKVKIGPKKALRSTNQQVCVTHNSVQAKAAILLLSKKTRDFLKSLLRTLFILQPFGETNISGKKRTNLTDVEVDQPT
jgi:hypothetical protein